mgnify:FL=1
MKKLWDDKAWEDYKEWLVIDKKIVKKINDLIKDIERNGLLNGIGKPEKLKYRDGYSRRIDQCNRLIYNVINEIVIIYSCKGHYDE